MSQRYNYKFEIITNNYIDFVDLLIGRFYWKCANISVTKITFAECANLLMSQFLCANILMCQS